MEFIHYSEVLYLMDKLDHSGKPIPFSFTCSTAEGHFLTMNKAVKNVLDKTEDEIRVLQRGIKERMPQSPQGEKKMYVRVKDMENGDIRTVYPRTFIRFNGSKVVFDI